MDITQPSPLTTTVRDALKGIGGVLVGIGAVSSELWATISGIVVFVVPAAYEAYKQLRMKRTA